MTFPVKYLEENLLFNTKGEVFAYYEWAPYNYSFISEDKAMTIFNKIQAMIAESGAKNIEFYSVGAEESIHDKIVRSKDLVKGDLKNLAYDHLEGVEESLKQVNGDFEASFKFIIGFQLSESDDEFSKKSIVDILKLGLGDLKNSVNDVLFNDYVVLSNEVIERYLRIESLMYHKVGKSVDLKKVDIQQMGYLIEHINGAKGVSVSDYFYHLPVITNEKETMVKAFDVLRLNSPYLVEHQRYLELSREESEQYVSYFVVADVVGENEFPYGSEIFYYQQAMFDYPIDITLKVERIGNKDALSTIRAKKMDLKDLDENAFESGNESSNNLLDARDDANEIEADLERSKEDMYKLHFLVRVSAESQSELSKRNNEVKDFFNSYNLKVERPAGDQLGLHDEFFPSSARYMNDYLQYAGTDFLASLGFGATQQLGEDEGIYIGWNLQTGKSVFIQPWLAAQGVEGSATNALAKALIGSLGGGKSLTENLLTYYTVLYGGRAFMVDPKSERGEWKEKLPQLEDNLKLIDISASEKNVGLLDPFAIMSNAKDAERLALDTLTFLTGITARDSELFPVLRNAIRRVSNYGEKRGMLHVITELKSEGEVGEKIASHIESFTDLSIASLLFGDGEKKSGLSIDASLNVALIQDLILPDSETEIENYSTIEMLSVALLIILATFSLDFIKRDRSVFKVVSLDEAWAWLQVSEGKTVSNKLVREGRQRNSAVDFSTQNTDDLSGEKMKNNIGLKFAFRSTDSVEIEKTLTFFGLEHTEANKDTLRNLNNGECLFQDLRGNVGVIYIDYVFEDLFEAFDTRPPIQIE
ncbi:ATP-binding protein [Tetragenococcus halophilus]